MKTRLVGILAVACVAVLSGVFSGTAAGESRNRDLERLVAKGMYSAGDGAQIQKSFAAALNAGIRESDALSLVETCVDGEFDAAQTQRALSIATQLALEGLPIESYIAKIEEGVSKRAAPAAVVQVAERRALALNKARQILNALVLQGATIDDRDELLPDLASALEAGRSPEQARAIILEALKEGESAGGIRRKLFP